MEFVQRHIWCLVKYKMLASSCHLKQSTDYSLQTAYPLAMAHPLATVHPLATAHLLATATNISYLVQHPVSSRAVGLAAKAELVERHLHLAIWTDKERGLNDTLHSGSMQHTCT